MATITAIFLFMTINLSFGEDPTCAPKYTYIPFPGNFEGDVQYARFHPNGDYILFTKDGKSLLAVIADGKIEIKDTPLNGEAFPAPGNWEIIASPMHQMVAPGYSSAYFHGIFRVVNDTTGEIINPRNGHIVDQSGNILKRDIYQPVNGGLKDASGNNVISTQMKYYRFSDILNQGQSARDFHSDFEVNDWYQSLATLQKTGSNHTVAVLDQSANYRVTHFGDRGPGMKPNARAEPVQKACPQGIEGIHTYRNASEKKRWELRAQTIVDRYQRVQRRFTEMHNGRGCGFLALAYENPGRNVVVDMDNRVLYSPPEFVAEKHLSQAIDGMESRSAAEYANRTGSYVSQLETPYDIVRFDRHEMELVPSSYNCLAMNDGDRKSIIAEFFWLAESGKQLSAEYQQIQSDLGNLVFEGDTLQQPIISPDGKEFALVQETTRIFALTTTGQCKETQDLKSRTGKVVFGPRNSGKKGRVAFTDKNGQLVVFDRDRDKGVSVNGEGVFLNSYTSYPGFLADGRVAFIGEKDGKKTLIIVDPNQVEPELGPCVPAASAGGGSDEANSARN